MSHQRSSSESSPEVELNPEETKAELLKRVKKKFSLKKSSKKAKPQVVKNPKNQHAVKSTRSVELKWSDFDGSVYKNVQRPLGGGTRHIDIEKTATKHEILVVAIGLFFPENSSCLGKLEDFVFDISLDAKGHRLMDDNHTLEHITAETKYKNLRFYLLSKRKQEETESSSDLDVELLGTSTVLQVQEETGFLQVLLPADDHQNTKQLEMLPDTVQLETSPEATDQLQMLTQTTDHLQMLPEIPDQLQCQEHQQDTQEGMMRIPSSLDHSLDELDIHNSSDPEIQWGAVGSNDEAVSSTTHADKIKTAIIRRGHVLEDFLSYFSGTDFNIACDRLEVQMIGQLGKPESGEDNGGVLRDALTEFWNSFQLKYTLGHDLKVPVIVHTMGMDNWKAVGKVIVVGFRQVGHFPIQMAPPFLHSCLYGNNAAVDDKDLLDSFLLYVSPTDRKVLIRALEEFDTMDVEEVIDALEDYQAKKVPTSSNLKGLLLELAHKELIQKPAFVSDVWRPLLQQSLSDMASNKGKLLDIYKEIKPSTKKVLQLLEFPENLKAQEEVVVDALKRYIKSLDEPTLEKFLCFCTGQ